MKLQYPLNIIAGDTAGIWTVSHRTSALSEPIVRADLSVGYSCMIKAVNAAGATVVPERSVTDRSPDNQYFLAALTPAETAVIPVGEITVAIQLTNLSLTPPLRKETHHQIQILANINSNA